MNHGLSSLEIAVGLRLLAAGALACAAQCASGQVQLRSIDARLVDPTAVSPTDPHIVALDAGGGAARLGKLYLHLVGTCAAPDSSSEILRVAGQMGFHAIGLSWPNCPWTGQLASGSTDPDIYEHIRQESLYGVDATPVLSVLPQDAAVSRTRSLLAWLDAQNPSEGWGQYLAGGSLRWDRIVLGGHSQGAGSATFLSYDHAVAGVLTFGGPGDDNPEPILPGWYSHPRATAAERRVDFVHTREALFAKAQAACAIMGLPALGPLLNVDGAVPNGTRLLSTSVTPVVPGAWHSSTIVDRLTPRTAGGALLFEPVWRYMLGVVLAPTPACGADFNADGVVDPDDLSDYIGCFFAAPACARADVNGDGVSDPDDLSDFIAEFFAGCH